MRNEISTQEVLVVESLPPCISVCWTVQVLFVSLPPEMRTSSIVDKSGDETMTTSLSEKPKTDSDIGTQSNLSSRNSQGKDLERLKVVVSMQKDRDQSSRKTASVRSTTTKRKPKAKTPKVTAALASTSNDTTSKEAKKPWAWTLQRMVSEVALTKPHLMSWTSDGSGIYFAKKYFGELNDVVAQYFGRKYSYQ